MLSIIARSLVDHPEEVRIRSVSAERTVTFWIYAHPEDAGKLIGTSGRMARALRVILQANAVKLKLQLILNICSRDEGRYA
jgi:hypothetical protein